MRVQGCGGQGLLHEGMVAARGAERELNVECDFPQCLRQHRLQKETPGHVLSGLQTEPLIRGEGQCLHQSSRQHQWEGLPSLCPSIGGVAVLAL